MVKAPTSASLPPTSEAEDEEVASIMKMMGQHAKHRGPALVATALPGTSMPGMQGTMPGQQQGLVRGAAGVDGTDQLVRRYLMQRAKAATAATPYMEPIGPNYICHLCGERGHHIRNCQKRQGKSALSGKKIKPATGIPRNWLQLINLADVALYDDVYSLPSEFNPSTCLHCIRSRRCPGPAGSGRPAILLSASPSQLPQTLLLEYSPAHHTITKKLASSLTSSTRTDCSYMRKTLFEAAAAERVMKNTGTEESCGSIGWEEQNGVAVNVLGWIDLMVDADLPCQRRRKMNSFLCLRRCPKFLTVTSCGRADAHNARTDFEPSLSVRRDETARSIVLVSRFVCLTQSNVSARACKPMKGLRNIFCLIRRPLAPGSPLLSKSMTALASPDQTSRRLPIPYHHLLPSYHHHSRGCDCLHVIARDVISGYELMNDSNVFLCLQTDNSLY